MQTIGVIGSGVVGQTLAAGFAAKGHAVTVGSRSPEKLNGWREGLPATHDVRLADVGTAAAADVVIIAVAGSAALDAVKLAGNLAGKVVIDTCNPIGGAPVNGYLPYFVGGDDSLMERLQRAAPEARFVKAFSCVGNALMIDPAAALGERPTMFICGDDAAAKAEVTGLLAEVGWDAEDVGGVQAARAVEPLCQLWCAPGFLRGDWVHAFKLLKR